MQFGKLARFVIVLLLGFVLALAGYPARSQDSYPEPEACYQEVLNDSNDDSDLDKYNDTELYCLFLMEVLYSGVIYEYETYSVDKLYGLIGSALSDWYDSNDESEVDDELTFAEIQAEFPGDELNNMIAYAVELSQQNQASASGSYNSLIPQTKARSERPETMHLRQPLNPIAQETRSTSGRRAAQGTARSAILYVRTNGY